MKINLKYVGYKTATVYIWYFVKVNNLPNNSVELNFDMSCCCNLYFMLMKVRLQNLRVWIYGKTCQSKDLGLTSKETTYLVLKWSKINSLTWMQVLNVICKYKFSSFNCLYYTLY